MESSYVAARLLSLISNSRWAQAMRWFLNVSKSESAEQTHRLFSSLGKESGEDLRFDSLRLEMECITKQGYSLIFLGDEQYPDSLLKLDRPPLMLMYKGAFPKAQPLLGVVGSREIRSETRQWLLWNLEPLMRQGLITISGGARGVDQMVHRLAITSRAPTIAILPSGLANPYPNEWARWQQEVCDTGGALVSELAPQAPMRPHYFHARNRLIAGLAGALLVVQARRSSGSTMSGRLALALHRDVGVVPGFPVDRDWLGSCDLITEGGLLMRDTHDLKTLVDRASSKIF